MNSNLKQFVLINNFYYDLKFKLFKNDNEINSLYSEITYTHCRCDRKYYFAKIDLLELRNKKIRELINDIEVYHFDLVL